VLGALGRLDQNEYASDPSLRRLIDVVPFGLPADPPVKSRRVLKGVVQGIGEADRVLLWGGRIWNWFDPLTVIRAVAELGERRDDIKLYFLGVQQPNPETEEIGMDADAVVLAKELGVFGESVFFNFGWVPYEDRVNFLLEADLGISAHFDNVETRFAFRTRMFDYLWAGLPIVATRGDVLSDLVEGEGLGRVTDEGDVEGWATGVEQLLDDAERYDRAKRNIEGVRPEFEWPNAVRALVRLVSDASRSSSQRKRTEGMVVRHLWFWVIAAVIKQGFRAAFVRAFQTIRQATGAVTIRSKGSTCRWIRFGWPGMGRLCPRVTARSALRRAA
jgi:glycosyltransferase involved in cell wall biosynthesis